MDVRETLRAIATGKGPGLQATERLVRLSWPARQQLKGLLNGPAALPRSPQSNRVLPP